MVHEHFQPELVLDPQEQKRLQAHLQEVDLAAFKANQQVLARTVGRVDAQRFHKLAVATATARAHWVAAALAMSDKGAVPSAQDVAHLAERRAAYQELSEAYEAARRMVERGYLCYLDKAQA